MGSPETAAAYPHKDNAVEKVADGERVAGAPTLAKHMPEAVVRRGAEWLGINWSGPRPRRRPRIISMADVEPEEVHWLIHPYVPRRKVTLFL